MSSEPPQSDSPVLPDPTPPEAPPRASFLRGMLDNVRHAGREVLSVTLGRILERPDQPDEDAPDAPPPADGAGRRRLSVLHAVTEQLRGAADSYVAAKLDEIEERVDQKLDVIEKRIDEKILELHRQLTRLRDEELRHRLRLLKLTLIFTVLVAVLSLVYKWVALHWLA